MKLVFFSFKHRHRYKDLNNFLSSRNYGKYFVLNLGGPFKYWIAKVLIFFKLGKAISCDGRPLIKDKLVGINFWMRGTSLDIPKNLRTLNNNFVTIYNSFLKNEKIFQVYPINLKKININTKLKIIYMSTIKINTTNEQKTIWEKYKDQIVRDFSLIDKEEFWGKIFPTKNDDEKYLVMYKKFKHLLRFEIIKKVKEKFEDRLNLFGDDWNLYQRGALPSNYNVKKNKKIYGGNICLDLGSIEGSSSLYSRSNQIIESGGLIVQCYQYDGKEVWGDLKNKIIFNNFSDLISILENLISDQKYCSFLLEEIYARFQNSNKYIEKSLDEIFM